ncbi:glutathione S-transferase [Mycena crocata]|nr:glutathione S-transferase [Mycena crocata]
MTQRQKTSTNLENTLFNRLQSSSIHRTQLTMVLRFYASTYVAGGGALVGLVLAEKKIPYEFVPIDMSQKEHKSPEFLAKQPFGQVPVIDDDGFILYESRAICRYLEEKYAGQGPRLIPTGLKEKALFEQAASVEFANFHPASMKVATEALGKPRRGLPVDQALLAEALSEFSAKLDVYDGILAKQKFIAGDEFTLADIFHLSYASMLAGGGIDIMTSKPNVARWWNEIISRPAWVKLKEESYKSTTN